ncbi:transmembrane protein, putative (macronuclear) [Tetrahymena thermophila SB210]|uniref:Transmembrane protein, putative n=1 Tax=Tetrahymena thermophila (strain SB210) TaxID=312017 RepID=I7LZJ3_TETTS|nr:transmembrane protein, putative [Tetrahymena thermophila SB210]EAR84040.2 transmembrane protein, putative [Tetrahymena thermophila SB210]|eukprot:XP_001031703.2 transmembrane protein, putative [Tetrahymena thermophila SB210]
MKEVYLIFIITNLIKVASTVSIECQIGQYFDLFDNVCKDCSSGCTTCYDSSNQSCLQCAQGYKYDFYKQSCVTNCQSNQVEYNNQCVQCQVENCIQCDKQFICNKCDHGYILKANQNKCVPDCPDSQVLEDVCKYSCSNNFLDIQNRKCVEKQYCPSTIRYNNFCNSNVILTAVIYDTLLYTFDNGGQIQVLKYPSLDYVTQKLFSSDSQIIDWIFLSINKKKVISISSTQINLIDLEIFALLNSTNIPSSRIVPNAQILYNQKMYITPSGSNLIIIDFLTFNQTSFRLKEDTISTAKAWDTKKLNLIIKNDDFSFSYIDTVQNSVIQVSCTKCQGISTFYLTDNIFIGNNYSQALISIFYLNFTEASGDLIFQKTLTIQGIIVYDNLLPPYYIIFYSEETYCLYFLTQEQQTLVTYLEDDYDFQIEYETLDFIIFQQNDSSSLGLQIVQDTQAISVYNLTLNTNFSDYYVSVVQGFNKQSLSIQYLFILFEGKVSVFDQYKREAIQSCFQAYSYKTFIPVLKATEQMKTPQNNKFMIKQTKYFRSANGSMIGYLNSRGYFILIQEDTEQLINTYYSELGQNIDVCSAFQSVKQSKIYLIIQNIEKNIFQLIVLGQINLRVLDVVFIDNIGNPSQIQCFYSVDKEQIVIGFIDSKLYLYQIDLLKNYKVIKSTQLNSDYLYGDYEINMQNQLVFTKNQYFIFIILNFNLDIVFEQQFSVTSSLQIGYAYNQQNNTILLQFNNMIYLYQLENSRVIQEINLPNLKIQAIYGFLDSPWVFIQDLKMAIILNYLTQDIILQYQQEGALKITQQNWFSSTIFGFIRNQFELNIFNCDSKQLKSQSFGQSIFDYNIYDFNIALVTFLTNQILVFDYLNQNIINQINLGNDIVSFNVILPVDFQLSQNNIIFQQNNDFLFFVTNPILSSHFDIEIDADQTQKTDLYSSYISELDIFIISSMESVQIFQGRTVNNIIADIQVGETIGSVQQLIQNILYLMDQQIILIQNTRYFMIFDIINNFQVVEFQKGIDFMNKITDQKMLLAYGINEIFDNSSCLYDLKIKKQLGCQQSDFQSFFNSYVNQIVLNNKYILYIQEYIQKIQDLKFQTIWSYKSDGSVNFSKCNDMLQICLLFDQDGAIYLIQYFNIEKGNVSVSIFSLINIQAAPIVQFIISYNCAMIAFEQNVNVQVLCNQGGLFYSKILYLDSPITRYFKYANLNELIIYITDKGEVKLQQLDLLNYSNQVYTIKLQTDSNSLSEKSSIQMYQEKELLIIYIGNVIYFIDIYLKELMSLTVLDYNIVELFLDKDRQTLHCFQLYKYQIFSIEQIFYIGPPRIQPNKVQSYTLFVEYKYLFQVDTLQDIVFFNEVTNDKDTQLVQLKELKREYIKKNFQLNLKTEHENKIYAQNAQIILLNNNDLEIDVMIIFNKKISRILYNIQELVLKQIAWSTTYDINNPPFDFYSHEVIVQDNYIIFFDFKNMMIKTLVQYSEKSSNNNNTFSNNLFKFLNVTSVNTYYKFMQIYYFQNNLDALVIVEQDNRLKLVNLFDNQLIFDSYVFVPNSQISFQIDFVKFSMMKSYLILNNKYSFMILDINNSFKQIYYQVVTNNIQSIQKEEAYNILYIIEDRGYSINVFDLDTLSIQKNTVIFKPGRSNIQITIISSFIVIYSDSQVNFYNRSTKRYILSYRYIDKQYKVQNIQQTLFDNYYIVVMNQAIRLITIDFVSQQSFSLFQVNLEQSEVFSVDFDTIYSKFTIEIQSLKYGEYVISNIVFFYKQWLLQNNEFRVKNVFNNFKQIRQKLLCAFEFVMNPNEINNIVEQELLQQSSNAFNFAITSMQVYVKEQARFQIPYLDESYIGDGGISIKLQKYAQNSNLENNQDTSLPIPADQKYTMVLKETLNFLNSNAVNFDNLIVSFKYLKGQVIELNGNKFQNLQDIIFSYTDIYTDIKNSTLYLRNLEKVVFHNINFQNMQQIETPSSGMGVISIDNVLNVVIDGVNFTNIDKLFGRGSFLRVTNSLNVQIKNINFNNITCVGYSAKNLQQLGLPTTINYLNYFLHFENVTNLEISYINMNSCKWTNFYFLRTINISNVVYFNNSQITQQIVIVNQTLDQILQQGYQLNQECKINGIFANQISQSNIIQVNHQKQREFKANDSIYLNYNLFICLPQSFFSFFLTQAVQLNNILIDDLQLNAVEFNIFNFIQTNQILSDNITFSNIFQTYLQNPPLAQAINTQGSQQFEISNSVFEKNSNIRFIFTPNLPISQAELVQNQFVKFNKIQVRNSQHFACLIEGSAYDNVIINSYFYNLINGQTLKQIQELQSNNQYIYFSKQPSGIIGLYSIHSLLLKNNIFLSCKSYSSAAIYLSQGYIIQFIQNKFEANQALTIAGAVNLQNIISITLVGCTFSLNKASESAGGAIIIQQSLVYQFTGNIFQGNQAKKDSAGAILLISTDIKSFYGNYFENNQAAIGGCMRFYYTLPSFFDKNNTYLQNNTFKNNKASLYGPNIASDPQGINLVQQNLNSSTVYVFNQTQNYTVINQISGDYLQYPLKVVLTDQDMIPIIFPYSLYLQNQNNLKDANQQTINQNENPDNNFPIESDQITQQFQSYQIQVIPYPSMHIDESSITTVYDFQCKCYIINFSLSAKPLFNSSFKIQTKNSYYITDFNNTQPQLLFQPLSLTINVEFGKCLPGDILVFNDQIVTCQPCPSGKYTLVDISSYTQYDSNLQKDQSLQQCKICPEQAVSCEKNIINLKNGFWRLNNMTDLIYDCQDSRDSCLPEDPKSRQGCKTGYIGIYCAECDYRAKLWDFQYGRFYDQDCQTCSQINQWSNIVFTVIILIFLFIYNYMQVNRQRKFAKKSCISYYLRKFNFMLIGKSGLIDHGAVYTKIFINYLQIMFLLFSNKLQIPIVRQILQLLGGDPLQLQYASMDCVISNFSSLPIYVNKTLFQQLLPLTILALCILVLAIQKNISQRRKNITFQTKYIFPSMRDFKAQGLFIYLFYSPSFLIKLISYMFCSSTISFSHLVGDHSYSCFTAEHKAYFYTLLLPLFILWAFLIPLTVIFILRKNSNKLYYIWIKQSYGFLYQEYNDKKYFWEFVKIYMKILIMVVVIAFNNDLSLRYVIVIFILFIYFLITLQANPYITKDLNYCDRISNLTIILSVIIDLFLNQSSSSSFVFQQVNQIIILVINCFFLLLILKRLILKPLPFSYSEMNLFQKMIYKLRNIFPALFSFVQFQPQNPFNIFRNWKRLKLIIQNFQEMRKSRNLFNDQFFKTFQQTRFYGQGLNEITSHSSQKSQIESIKIRERQPIHLSSLPCNMSIEDFDQQDSSLKKSTKKGQFIKTVKTEPYDINEIQLGSVQIKSSEKNFQNKICEDSSVFEENMERLQEDKYSINDISQQKFISIFKLNRKGFEEQRSNFQNKNQESNQIDQTNFTNFYEVQSPSSFYQNEFSSQNIRNQSSIQDKSQINQLKLKSISQLNQNQSSHKFKKV